ncbi:hypothetical protein LRD18_11120 [Halorhodospira halochloris]|uniref:hypothetical protein n=1 Tax=Halorhodospira halochloris TaxID=1052 RepID=UPI001EE88656|nr:hypothetical protein [Halorhodospira halochloris]MCG5531399.1 hypothetical protein [Halorhodospira halochloris]
MWKQNAEVTNDDLLAVERIDRHNHQPILSSEHQECTNNHTQDKDNDSNQLEDGHAQSSTPNIEKPRIPPGSKVIDKDKDPETI